MTQDVYLCMKKKVKEKSWLRNVIPVGIYRLMLGLNTASMPFPEPPFRAV